MMNQKIDAFVDKLRTDTLSTSLTWQNISTLDDKLRQRSDIADILHSDEYSSIVTTDSFFTNLSGTPLLLLVLRRTMSGKDGTYSDKYGLYMQEPVAHHCHELQADQMELARLSTVIKLMCPPANTLSPEIESIIDQYLEKS